MKAWRADPNVDKRGENALKVGWGVVRREDPIVVFFDGGKTDDHTAVSGCRLSDGYVFALGHWGRPPGATTREEWFAPREEVDARMKYVVEERFNVVALWGDPSYARDDEDDTAYWQGLLDEWHRRWKDRLKYWAVRTGTGQHAVIWDMSSPAHQAVFVQQGAEVFQRDMLDRRVVHDGNPQFVRYMKNAKGYQTKFGRSLWKGARGSQRKIDGAVTHVGARMLRNLVLNWDRGDESKAGHLWGFSS